VDSSVVGATIFNASLGPGWTYKLRSVRGNVVRPINYRARSFLSVDGNGQIQVKSRPSCKNHQQNPYTVYVISETAGCVQTNANYSMIPVNVHLHGQNCFTKFRRKSQRLLYNLPVLSFRLNWRQGACLSSNSHVVNLLTNLPQSLEKCSLTYRTDTNDFRVGADGSIQTARNVCLDSDSWIIGIKLTSVCGGRNIELPLKVVLLSQYGLEREFQVHHSIKHLRRMKRGTNVNNHTPIFPQPYYVRHVAEEKPAGLLVDTITATDDDTGAAGLIKYS
jgi:hypothetical protein